MTVEAKAWRLINTGRVTITHQTEDVLAGTVAGDHDTYQVSIDPDGEHCTCPARVRCSHIIALDLFEMTDDPELSPGPSDRAPTDRHDTRTEETNQSWI